MPKAKSDAMHVVKVTSRQGGREYVSYLLRNSYREGGKVKKQTLANLSHLPLPIIDLVRRALAGEPLVSAQEGLVVERSRPHGHVAAVLGLARRLKLDTLLAPVPSRQRELALGLVVERVLHPRSKLATAQGWSDSTLAEELGVEPPDVEELYAALDWLGAQQERVEGELAHRHLEHGSVVLYDVTSTYLTGKHCPLAAYGYSRDHRRDREQVVFGLVLDGEGRPLGVEAFAGNTADPATVERQAERVKDRYGLESAVLVGDRGMLTQARIEGLRERGGLDWISCLRGPAVQALLEQQAFQLSLFDQTNLVEITHPSYPGERLVVCRNPLLAEERGRKREELLQRTEAALAQVQARVAAGRLRGAAAMGLAVGKTINRWKMGKHVQVDIGAGSFTYRRNEAKIAAEAAVDGLYIVRTSLPAERLEAAQVVATYKSLSRAERAFRTFKTLDLQVRPVFHYREDRVRAHLFLCLLAAYLQWHLERAWAPLLFREEESVERQDPVAKAQRSEAARAKDGRRQTGDGSGLPVQSFRTLMSHLATQTKNRVVLHPSEEADGARASFDLVSLATPLQARAFALLKDQATAL